MDARPGIVITRGRICQLAVLPIFVAGQEYATVFRRRVDVQVAARNFTPNQDGRRFLVTVAAGFGVAHPRGSLQISGHALLTAVDTVVRDDRQPDRSGDVKQRNYQCKVAFHC